jgi:hypothetical protein
MWPAFRVRVVLVQGSPADMCIKTTRDLFAFFLHVQGKLVRLDCTPLRILVAPHLLVPMMMFVSSFRFTTLSPVCFKSSLIPNHQTNVSLSHVRRG